MNMDISANWALTLSIRRNTGWLLNNGPPKKLYFIFDIDLQHKDLVKYIQLRADAYIRLPLYEVK